MVRFVSKPKRGRRQAPKAKAQGRRRKANVKARKARLSTLTRSGSKRVVSGSSEGITTSQTRYTARARNVTRSLPAFGAPCTYVVTREGAVSAGNPLSVSGLQAYSILGAWYSVPDIVGLSSQVPRIKALGGLDVPTHFRLKALDVEVSINNPTSNTQIYDIYDVVCKRDIPLTSVTGLTISVSSPLIAWVNGMAQQVDPSTGITVPPDPTLYLGSKPTDAQLFNDYYRVVKHTQLIMPQNASHVHKIVVNPNQTMDLSELLTMSSYLIGVKDVTMYSFAIMRGTVGLDITNNSSTTFAGAMRWVSQEHHRFSFLQSQGSTWNGQNNVSYGSAPTGILLNSPAAGVPLYN